MHRVGVSAPDIAGADESNPPAPESFRSTVACFELASGLFRPVPFPRGRKFSNQQINWQDGAVLRAMSLEAIAAVGGTSFNLPVCTENLSSGVVVVKSAEAGV